MKKISKVCVVCNAPFESSTRAITCGSEKCKRERELQRQRDKQKAYRKGKKDGLTSLKKECVVCHKKFESSTNTVTCGDEECKKIRVKQVARKNTEDYRERHSEEDEYKERKKKRDEAYRKKHREKLRRKSRDTYWEGREKPANG